MDIKPIKGTSDWLPEEYALRRYIFDTWEQVNRSFGYQPYLTPLLEPADLYRAKSGEDLGGKELLTLTDRANRELAIRPEMTPSVTRLVAGRYNQLPKPIRLYSIANFFRNEKPQRGRNREFWQLNTDIFGSTTQAADLEILQISLEIMLKFNPPKDSFILYLNHRQLSERFLTEFLQIEPEKIHHVIKFLDKYPKLNTEQRHIYIEKLLLSSNHLKQLEQLESITTLQELKVIAPGVSNLDSYNQLSWILEKLHSLGYEDYCKYNPFIVRGIDYYDGLVFEVFDLHPNNNRAMFGGGRYNSLANIFGQEVIPAVGFAPGDETTKLFLESWNILPDKIIPASQVYIPLLDDQASQVVLQASQYLRSQSLTVQTGIERQTFRSALDYANKQQIPYVILIGSQEMETNQITVKNMASGDQHTILLENAPQYLT